MLRLTGKYFVLDHLPDRRGRAHGDRRGVGLTGGSNGIFDVPPPYPFLLSNRAYYYFALGFAVLGVGFCARILTSEYGRAIDSIREGERLAECSGVPVIRFKVTVFVIACALAGMTGSLQAHYIKFVGPDAYSGFQSLNLVVMNVIGGMSSLTGALLGTVFMVTLPELLRGYVNLQQIMFGVILFATMAFLPGGLIELGQRLRGLLWGRRPDAEPIAETSAPPNVPARAHTRAPA